MGHSGRFQADNLGPEWAGLRILATVCERSRLTNLQAKALLLWCRGFSYAEVTRLLVLPHSSGRSLVLGAVDKLADRLTPVRRVDRRWLADLLWCFRNRREGSHRSGLATQDRAGNWNWQYRAELVSVGDLAGEFEPEAELLRWLETRCITEEERAA